MGELPPERMREGIRCAIGIHRYRDPRSGWRLPEWYVGGREFLDAFCTRCGTRKRVFYRVRR